ncbi:uncharacterized protein YfbL-like [Babylonia areolata]|uniref:uncharacterized protein YfbL-like n=1 Tax=Babylonia areolata TaxID=304850 RepID=UPI003FD6A7D8
MDASSRQLFILFVCFALQVVRGEPRASWMKATLTSHFSQPRHHVTNPGYKMAAKNFINSQFLGMGLVTAIHDFETVLSNVTGHTVVGVMKGVHFGTDNDSIVAISAHYDTMRNTPGVNDNGAGVVVMLEAARELVQGKARNSTLLFIAFDFEEWESESDSACREILCGSKKFVSDWLPTYFRPHWPLAWKGLLNMDIVLNFDDRNDTQYIPFGFDQMFPDQFSSISSDNKEGDFLTVAGRAPGDMDLMQDFNTSWLGLGHSDFEVEMFPIPSQFANMARDLSRSDHASFWKANLSALFLTDTAEYRGYMKQCYHSQCDNLTFATDERMQFAAKISKALVAWVDRRAPSQITDVAAMMSTVSLWMLLAAVGVTMMTSQ